MQMAASSPVAPCVQGKERNSASLTAQTKIVQGEMSSDVSRFSLCRILELVMKMYLPFLFK